MGLTSEHVCGKKKWRAKRITYLSSSARFSAIMAIRSCSSDWRFLVRESTAARAPMAFIFSSSTAVASLSTRETNPLMTVLKEFISGKRTKQENRKQNETKQQSKGVRKEEAAGERGWERQGNNAVLGPNLLSKNVLHSSPNACVSCNHAHCSLWLSLVFMHAAAHNKTKRGGVSTTTNLVLFRVQHPDLGQLVKLHPSHRHHLLLLFHRWRLFCLLVGLIQKRKVRQLATLLLNVAKLLFCQLSQLHLMAPFFQEWNLVELSHLRSALCQKEKAKSHFLAASLVARLLLLLLCGRDECSDASFGPAGSRCAACCWRHLPACDHGGGKAVSGKR